MNYISEAWVLEEEEKRTRLEKRLNQILEGLKAIIRNLRYWTGSIIIKKSLGKISLVTPGVMDLKDKSLRSWIETRGRNRTGDKQEGRQGQDSETDGTIDVDDEINSILRRARKPSIWLETGDVYDGRRIYGRHSVGVWERNWDQRNRLISYQIPVVDLPCVPLWRVPGTPMYINVSQTWILMKTMGAKLVYKESVSSVLTSMAWHMLGERFYFYINDCERRSWNTTSLQVAPCPETKVIPTS